jgi:hypothetical protein
MPALAASKVDATESERHVQELLEEVLKSYFNGAEHPDPVTGEEIAFPACDLFYNQTSLPTPSPDGKSQIHTVFTDLRRRPERMQTPEEKLVEGDSVFSFFVRTANQGGDNRSDFENRRIADLVKRIFQVGSRAALARKNIMHARISRGPVPLATVGYQARLLIIEGRVRYTVPRITPLPP